MHWFLVGKCLLVVVCLLGWVQGHLTENEQEAVLFMKSQLEDMGLFNATRHDKYTLMRFLVSEKMKLTEAVAKLVRHEEWRRSNQVDQVVESFAYPEIDQVQHILTRYFHKTDKHGRPIVIEKLSHFNMDTFLKTTDMDRFTKYFIREQEKLVHYRFPAASKSAKHHVDKVVVIMDLKGISLVTFSQARKIISHMGMIASENYPETLGSMYIINPPTLFSTVWAVATAWMDANTVNKIKILGSNYKSQLLEHIHSHSLPAEYGGSCTCGRVGCSNSDAGPWHDDPSHHHYLHSLHPHKWDFSQRDGL